MSLEAIDLNSPPVVTVGCNNRKATRKKTCTEPSLKNQQKTKEKDEKMEIKF